MVLTCINFFVNICIVIVGQRRKIYLWCLRRKAIREANELRRSIMLRRELEVRARIEVANERRDSLLAEEEPVPGADLEEPVQQALPQDSLAA